MIFKIEIENFFSIKDRQVVDLRAHVSADDSIGALWPLFSDSEDRVPSVVAIFGANAAGKSNVLRAISFCAWFAGKSFEHGADRRLPYTKFGNTETIGTNTRLALSFVGPKSLADVSGTGPTCPYKYEVELGPRGEGSHDRVIFEKLSYQPNGVGKYSRIVERSDQGKVRAARGFLDPGIEKLLERIMRPSASVISTLAQLNHQAALSYINVANSVYSNILFERSEGDENVTAEWYASNSDAMDELRSVAQRLDLGIEEIEVNSNAKGPAMLLRHAGIEQIMGINEESHGTRQFIKVFPFIFLALKVGGIAVVDEVDASIHPVLLPEVLRWFSDRQRNPLGAQIFVTCHSATLLSDLAKEEVLFCEKDRTGGTRLYSLSSVSGIRRSENFLGNYLGGRYGALPSLG